MKPLDAYKPRQLSQAQLGALQKALPRPARKGDTTTFHAFRERLEGLLGLADWTHEPDHPNNRLWKADSGAMLRFKNVEKAAAAMVLALGHLTQKERREVFENGTEYSIPDLIATSAAIEHRAATVLEAHKMPGHRRKDRQRQTELYAVALAVKQTFPDDEITASRKGTLHRVMCALHPNTSKATIDALVKAALAKRRPVLGRDLPIPLGERGTYNR